LRERYVAIILDGLRPLAASTLAGDPLDFAHSNSSRRGEPETDTDAVTAP